VEEEIIPVQKEFTQEDRRRLGLEDLRDGFQLDVDETSLSAGFEHTCAIEQSSTSFSLFLFSLSLSLSISLFFPRPPPLSLPLTLLVYWSDNACSSSQAGVYSVEGSFAGAITEKAKVHRMR
jgi:hypothetical protein